MLVELTVENVAIIEKVRLDLGSGFTALTGETGAGKSLLVDAIELALGERADTDLVRSGSPSATVTAVFDLSATPDFAALCAEMGYPAEDSLLAIQREVAVEGRSTCRINGKTAPVSVLKRIGRSLVDLHGQHDHQSLMHPEAHLGLLDAWIGQPAVNLREAVAEKFGVAAALRTEFSRLRTGRRDRESRIDLLQFQIGEITKASLIPGELGQVEGRLTRLKNAEKLGALAASALASLVEEGTALDSIRVAEHQLSLADRLDPAAPSGLEGLRTAQMALEDATHQLRQYADSLEADPAELELAADRLDEIRRLVRKYCEHDVADPVAAVLEYLHEATLELDTLSAGEEGEARLEARIAAAEAELKAAADQLTALRLEKAPEFSRRVTAELRELAMERAEFEVFFAEMPVTEAGQDKAEFLFCANHGESLRPLAKIASGGELSRTMLGIKVVLANTAGVPVMIFDEVDAGLSGRAAVVVGLKLQALASHAQVIVITHLPQIAAKAATHFHIEKVESGDRVRTTVRGLIGAERTEELARLLGGEATSEAALANASELLKGHSPSLGI